MWCGGVVQLQYQNLLPQICNYGANLQVNWARGPQQAVLWTTLLISFINPELTVYLVGGVSTKYFILHTTRLGLFSM